MKNPTLLLPGFHLQTFRKTPRSAQQMMAEKRKRLADKTLSQLGECFSKLIPNKHLQPARSGASSRQRIFSRENTFWAFFAQVMDPDGGCQEVVRKLQSIAAMKSKKLRSLSTAAYCKARKRLDHSTLEAIFKETAARIEFVPDKTHMKGRRVVVVDGTGVSMPDTDENQYVEPPQKAQRTDIAVEIVIIKV